MSIAPERDAEARMRLFRPASLILFGVLVLAVVYGVAWQYGWHGGRSFNDSAGDAQAQLQSAALMLQSGQYAAAREQIAPILSNRKNPLYRRARLMQWQIARTRALAIPPQSPARRRAEAGLLPLLDGLLQLGGWTPPELRSLAKDAFAVGAYGLSAKFWIAAAKADPAFSQQDQWQAAQALAAGGDAAAAGQILLDLAAQTPNLARQKALLLQGGQWLQGGASAAVALTRCQALLVRRPGLWQDRKVVLFMSRLAMAAGQPVLAAQWLHSELLRPEQGRKSS
ncbi:hypothetical protein [Acidithiobacillus sp.]|uniref:hypothetical protein n=1 Tax=Acidithiobacillus sp. TaxID=1872118 RepID=UPI0032AE9390